MSIAVLTIALAKLWCFATQSRRRREQGPVNFSLR